jgi:hypothetical protein
MRRGLATAWLAAAACTSEPVAPPPSVKAAVLRTTDTVHFEARAAVYRCEGAKGVLFEAIGAGSGLLVWVRDPRDSIVDTFAVIGVRDSLTRRGAVVAVRYVAEAVPYTVSLDSGTVVVARADSGGARGAGVTIRGSGLDVRGGVRTAVDASFDALPPPIDSTACSRAR